MKFTLFTAVLLAANLVMIPSSRAQVPSTPETEKGFTEIETFQGTLNSSGKLLKIDSQLGYNFNQHFDVFTGLPLYVTNVSTSSTGTTSTPTGTQSGIGNLYLGFNLRAPNPRLNYGTTVTAGAPTGDASKGLSTGRATIDWNNHFDRTFGLLTPYLDAGLSNTVPDSILITRPFTSLGKIGHFEEGVEIQLPHSFTAGASGYEIAPMGTQKIYSKVLRAQAGQTSGTGRSGRSGNSFQTAPVTSGSDLTRENGVNTWFAFQPTELWRAEIGYSRSATFDL